jgi:hypothetical protein
MSSIPRRSHPSRRDRSQSVPRPSSHIPSSTPTPGHDP